MSICKSLLLSLMILHVATANAQDVQLPSPAIHSLSRTEMLTASVIGSRISAHWHPEKIHYDKKSIKDPLVEIHLNPDGTLQRVTILESSGNDALDASLIRAIQMAAPFMLPKQQFEAFRLIRLRFHPLK